MPLSLSQQLIKTLLQSIAHPLFTVQQPFCIFFSSLLPQLRLQDQSLIALHTLMLFAFLSPFGEPYFLTYPTCALKVWNVDWGKT